MTKHPQRVSQMQFHACTRSQLDSGVETSCPRGNASPLSPSAFVSWQSSRLPFLKEQCVAFSGSIFPNVWFPFSSLCRSIYSFEKRVYPFELFYFQHMNFNVCFFFSSAGSVTNTAAGKKAHTAATSACNHLYSCVAFNLRSLTSCSLVKEGPSVVVAPVA